MHCLLLLNEAYCLLLHNRLIDEEKSLEFKNFLRAFSILPKHERKKEQENKRRHKKESNITFLNVFIKQKDRKQKLYCCHGILYRQVYKANTVRSMSYLI